MTTSIVAGAVRVLDGSFVVVLSVANGMATVRFEDDRTNTPYTVIADYLK